MIKTRHLLLSTAFAAATLCSFPAHALSPIKFGLRAGIQTQSMNLSKGTTLRSISADENMGFQGGAMARISLGALYIQPELIYNYSPYTLYSDNLKARMSLSSFEVPVLLGYKFLFMRFMAGPTFNLMSNTKIRSGAPAGFHADIDNKALGYQIGVGVELLRRLNIDLRYDGQFGRSAQFISIDNLSQNFKTAINTFQLNLGWFF